MRKSRVGAVLIAVALSSSLFTQLCGRTRPPAPPESQETHIQNEGNDIDKELQKQWRLEQQARLRELARALRTSPPATASSDPPAGDVARPTGAEAAEGALPSVYDPDWSRGKFAHFSREELAAMAGRCELRWQLPPFAAAAPSPLGAEYDGALAAATEKYRAAAAALYREATGASGEGVSVRALDDALRAAGAADAIAAHRRLAVERAGDPPGERAATSAGERAVTSAGERAATSAGERAADSPSGEGSVYERWLRLQLGAGDDFEAALAGSAGAAQARAWREAQGAKLTLTGCDAEHALFRSSR